MNKHRDILFSITGRKMGVHSALLAAGLGLLVSAQAEIRYVSPSGSHTPPFTNWAEAATNIQAALDAATAGDRVLATNGVYTHTNSIVINRDLSLESVNGYNQTMIQVSHTNHGVQLNNGTLRGFAVCGATNLNKLGIRVTTGTVDRCLIASNYLGVGHESTRSAANLTITDSIVQNNFSRGVFLQALASLHMDNVQVLSNRSAGLYAYMYQHLCTNALIRNSRFAYNTGHGLAFGRLQSNQATGLIDHCVAEYNGDRGMELNNGTTADNANFGHVRNCVIQYNRGGGIVAWRGQGFTPIIENCMIVNNTASAGSGGGINAHTIYIINCTIVGNYAATYGGGIYSTSASIGNSLVWNNLAPSYSNIYNNNGSYVYSCTAPRPSGQGNIDRAPKIASRANPRLTQNSPCIDAGNYLYSQVNADIDGEPRTWGGNIDIGCDEFFSEGLTGAVAVALSVNYDRAVVNSPIRFEALIAGKVRGLEWDFGDGNGESDLFMPSHAFALAGDYRVVLSAWNNTRQAAATVTVHVVDGYTNYVSLAGLHAYPYTNWASAATTLQDAVEACIPGGVVLVTDGVYRAGGRAMSGDLINRIVITNAITVISAHGPLVTVIEGQGPPGSNAVRCAWLANDAQLSGFTLANGATRDDSVLAPQDLGGGGVWCAGDEGISNCILQGNVAYDYGGGCHGGVLVDCKLAGNTAGDSGGGCYESRINHCLIESNRAAWDGGGGFAGVVSNTLFQGNQAGYRGGAAFASILHNCLAAGNTAQFGGGTANGINLHDTIVYNTAEYSGGGDYRGSNLNVVLYFNAAADETWKNYYNSICRYTCTTPHPETTGSFTDDPLFMNGAAGNYRLSAQSPCLDAGAPVSLARDLDGTPRPLDGTGRGAAGYDLGAYEYSRFVYASRQGGHVWPHTSWAMAATTVQAAADAAYSGQTLLVSNGVYETGGRFLAGQWYRVAVSNPIQIRSMNGPAATVLEGLGVMGCAYLADGANLSGFTLLHGAAADGAITGVRAEGFAGLSNCIVAAGGGHTNSFAVQGGAIYNSLLLDHSNRLLNGSAVFNSVLTRQTGPALGADSRLINCLVFSNSGGFASCSVNHSCLDFDPGGHFNIVTQQPHLADSGAGNYRPVAGSPCIDSGTNYAASGGSTDLDGIPRPLDGNGDSTAIFDMGAFEFLNLTADSDGDGLTDTNELYGLLTNPALRDTDGDDQGDGDEILAGTNPLDPLSYFGIVAFRQTALAGVAISWFSVTGRTYAVITATNSMQAWILAPDYPETPGSGQVMSYTNSAPGERRFFGVRLSGE